MTPPPQPPPGSPPNPGRPVIVGSWADAIGVLAVGALLLALLVAAVAGALR